MHPHPITLPVQHRCRDLPACVCLPLLKDTPALSFFSIRYAVAHPPHHPLQRTMTDSRLRQVAELVRCQPVGLPARQRRSHFLHPPAHPTIPLQSQQLIHRFPPPPLFILIHPALVSDGSQAAHQTAPLRPHIPPARWHIPLKPIIHHTDHPLQHLLAKTYHQALYAVFQFLGQDLFLNFYHHIFHFHGYTYSDSLVCH